MRQGFLVFVPGRDHRLGNPTSAVLAAVEHVDGGVLRHGAERGPRPFGKPGIFNTDQGAQFTSEELCRRILATPHMQSFIEAEFQPGSAVKSDEELLDYARRRGGTVYHPTSTCKMGGDPMAVVDPQLRVYGVEGLRVADASIMPTVVSGNTNAAAIMIGEKAADMVRRPPARMAA